MRQPPITDFLMVTAADAHALRAQSAAGLADSTASLIGSSSSCSGCHEQWLLRGARADST